MNTARYHSDEHSSSHNRITTNWNQLTPTQPSTIIRNQVFEQARQEDQKTLNESNKTQRKQDSYYQGYQPDNTPQTALPSTPSSLSEQEELTMELMERFSDDFVPKDRIFDTPSRQFWDLMQQRADYVLSMHKTFEAEKIALKQNQPLTELHNHSPTALTRLKVLGDAVDETEYEQIMGMTPLERLNTIYELTQGKTPKSKAMPLSTKRLTPPSAAQSEPKTEYLYSMKVPEAQKGWWDRTRDAAENSWDETMSAIRRAWDDTNEYVSSGKVLDDMGDVASQAAVEIRKQASNTAHTIGNKAGDLRDTVHHKSSHYYQEGTKALESVYRHAAPGVESIARGLEQTPFADVGGMLRNSYHSAGQAGKQAISSLGEESSELYLDATNTIGDRYMDAVATAGDAFDATADVITIFYGGAKIAYKSRHELNLILQDVVEEITDDIPPEISTVILDGFLGVAANISDQEGQERELLRMCSRLHQLPKEKVAAFFRKYGGDVHKLHPFTANWVEQNRSNFSEAQETFNASEDEIDATALAMAEEMNRNSQALNKLLSHIQDSTSEKFGYVIQFGDRIRPDIGPGNININTARAVVEKLKNHPKVNSVEIQEILRACQTDRGLARYIVTDRGAVLLGTAIMVIEGKSATPYYQNITNKDDLVQNMANHWREGKGRNKRMDEEKAKAEAEGEKYVVSHGYEDIESTPISMRGVHIHNRAIIRKALGRPD